MVPDPLSTSIVYTELIGFIVALLCCALFSFLETSITALRLFKLKELASTTPPKYHRLFETLEKRPNQVLITTLIANSLTNVTAAALITDIMEKAFTRLHLSGGLGFSLGIGIATIAILIFGEVIPKNMAKLQGEQLFPSTLWIINLTFFLLYPFVVMLMKLSSIVMALMGSASPAGETMISEREIRFLIDYINEKGLMEREKTEMLQSIFELGSKHVKEIMVPSSDIIMLNIESSIPEALRIFSQYQFTRLPVYQGTRDNVMGMIHLKDLFTDISSKQERPLKELTRPIMFVPESMKINQQLREFRLEHKHIALVLNEHGSITGLVTLEDILEEIVGEIRDEYEKVEEKIITLDSGGWLVDGSIDIDSIEELLNISLKVDHAVTLGGFLTEQLQHLPRKGEGIEYEGYYFEVKKASPRRVFQVLISSKRNE